MKNYKNSYNKNNTMFCKECGAKITGEGNFCPKCGAPTEKKIEKTFKQQVIHDDKPKNYKYSKVFFIIGGILAISAYFILLTTIKRAYWRGLGFFTSSFFTILTLACLSALFSAILIHSNYQKFRNWGIYLFLFLIPIYVVLLLCIIL